VRITERDREPLGLSFVGRGFAVRVRAPFDASLAEALTHTAAACVAACPTGALAHPPAVPSALPCAGTTDSDTASA
jgi:ferredoxin